MTLGALLRRPATVLSVAAFLLAACSSGQHSRAQTSYGDPTGAWLTEDGVAVVEIARCGDSLCGHLVSFPPLPNDPAANAELCNLQILGGFKQGGDGRWVEGWITAIEEEEVYQAWVGAASVNRLKVRAYVERESYGETVTWSRQAGAFTRCAP